MKISDFLSPDNVMIDVRTAHKDQLLQKMARKAASNLDLPADHVASELLKREQLGSTEWDVVPPFRMPDCKW